jgi:hypothetical protein
MAVREDVILSMYLRMNEFIQYLQDNTTLPLFEFVATTSIESANALLMDAKNKIILVQTELKEKHFLDIEYHVFVSFVEDLDVNALLTTEILSELENFMPKYSTLEVYEAEGLKAPQSIMTPTGCKFIVKSISQESMSTPQMRNNLTATVLRLTGYLN